MKEPKRYYCGNGEGMFEDDKSGHWVEYSEHKVIVEALTEQFRKHAVSGSLQDRLFELANDFAVDKQGDIAVKLHSIHNGLQ